MRRLLRMGLKRPFLALVVPAFVMTGVFGWQAVESQEVKNALRSGGFRSIDELRDVDGAQVTVSASYINAGDQAIDIHGVGLLAPSGVELVDPDVEGVELGPGDQLSLRFVVRTVELDEVTGFDGVRIHYSAGGRAGEHVDRFAWRPLSPG